MKYVIINADDFGLSKGVNEGIIRAFREGVLTSATIMANMEGFDQAVTLWKENRGLGVGVHLNILRGRPLLGEEKVKTLCGNGYFLGSVGPLFKRLLTHRIDISEVEQEWRAQIQKVIKSGITVTHLDSEKHLHCIPSFFRVAIKLAKEFDIRWIRSISEPMGGAKGMGKWIPQLWNPQFFKAVLLNYFSSLMRSEISNNGLKTPGIFYGVLDSGNMVTKTYERMFSQVGEGITEIMCHPGYMARDDEGNFPGKGKYYINNSRQKELQALLHPSLKVQAEKHGIKFLHYGELIESGN